MKLCQQEWQTLLTSDGKGFKNIGKCVSYAAKGGEFATPEPPEPPNPYEDALAFCAAFGGTVTTELRNGIEVLICTPPSEDVLPPESDWGEFCTEDVFTTEQRNGVTVLICTP